MDLLVRLTFINYTLNRDDEIITKRSTTKIISEWYATHHENDEFDIQIDGQNVEQDVNGAIAE